MRKQLYQLLGQLVNKHAIRLNEEELKLQLLSHPSYPSLHALTGVLDHFGINNLALQLPNDASILAELPDCFMANLQNGKQGDYLALVEKKRDKIHVVYEESKEEVLSKDAFLEQWNGVILAIEKDENVKESTHDSAKVMSWSLSILVLLLFSYFVFSSADLFVGAHFILSIAGFVLSLFLVQHELGLSSSATNDFCNLSANTSCDAVLHSKGAKLFGSFHLSDLSMVVFASYALNWLFYALGNLANYNLVLWTSALAIPFVLYSIYYQAQVVKKWCPLCLLVAAVLVCQALILPLAELGTAALVIDMESSLVFAFSLLLTIAAWDAVKMLLKKRSALEELELKHYKFKRNFALFNTLYQNGRSLTNLAPISGEITLGNKNAPIEIILVTSPFCFYCKKAHRDMESLLKSAREQVKLTIRFNAKTTAKENKTYRVVSTLLHLYNTKGASAAREALDQVYSESTDLEKWLEQQSWSIENTYDKVLEDQYRWCLSNEINFTPALFVNGKQYPMEYDREDLIYFLEDLIEQDQLNDLIQESMA